MATAEEIRDKLLNIQNFDTSRLPREAALGTELNFSEVVGSADKIVRFFQNIPPDHLDNLPDAFINSIEQQLNAVEKTFGEIESFSSSQENPVAVRTNLINEVSSLFNGVFSNLHPIVSYCSSQKRDFGAFEAEARSAVQTAEDAVVEIQSQLEEKSKEAEDILVEIRKVAGEQGVSQEAIYFKTESDHHETQAADWKKYTIWTAIGLGVYAAGAAYLHKIPGLGLAPSDGYDNLQLAISKVLVFSVITFMLILCARNFMSHRHNAVVNKHRQNALLTFNSLVKAAGSDEGKDIILTHAAGCIFAPQETGYTKSGSDKTKASASVIDAVPRMITRSTPASS